MRFSNLRKYLFLMRKFRNFAALVQAYRHATPISQAVLWNGKRLLHPEGRGGFVGTILELWLDQVYTRGFYCPRPGDVVVDAGAHVGLFTIFIARLEPRCRILAIEPYKENFKCLEANVKALALENVSIHKVALGPHQGRGYMKDGGSRSIDHVLELGASTTGDSVKVVTLEAIFDMACSERIALFKCDIEGSEADVLGAASANVLRRLEKIALEYHDNLRPGTLRALVSCLSKTHDLLIRPEPGQDHGLLLATLRGTKEPMAV